LASQYATGFSIEVLSVFFGLHDRLADVVLPAKILIAEDDDLTLELLATVLRGEGYEVVTVADGRAAQDRLRESAFDLVLSDIQMTRASGLEVLQTVTKEFPDTPVVLITAYAEPGAAMDAIGSGAADYLAKPVDIVALRATVARALERRRLAKENRSLRSAIAGHKILVGTCAPMLELYKQIAHVAPTDATVLVTGESGSGKELVARTIHERSRRANHPFVAFNCASLAEGLLESELFGHEKGAFTGANAPHKGLFETAEGGHHFPRRGRRRSGQDAGRASARSSGKRGSAGWRNSTAVKVNVRVISATNRDLAVEVAAGRLRQDLAYRLNVVSLHVPPLRERGDDLIALTRHLASRHAALLGRPELHISEEAMYLIRGYAWPGNVRELENALARAVAMSQRGVILPGDLPPLASQDETRWPGVD
jgi:two-component system response regulator AtoC